MTMAPPAELLTVAQVAKRLGVGVQFVQKRTRSGEIPSYKLGRAVRISEADLEAYMERQHSSATPSPGPPAPAPATKGKKVRRRPPPSTT